MARHKPTLVIIGGGIAGLSCGAAAAAGFAVTVLEAESQPGYHTSGRSAAVCIDAYDNAEVHALTIRSIEAHIEWGATSLGECVVADADHAGALDDYLAQWQPLAPAIREIAPVELIRRVPLLRDTRVARVVLNPNVLALDAHTLLDRYRRSLLEQGGRVVSSARVDRIERSDGRWVVGAGTVELAADVIVNAAGAWGDDIAMLAGLSPLGLRPLRRSAVLIDTGLDIRGWPLVHRAEGGLYFKPEGGQLMVSPMDETPSPPCDARPEELDIAIAIERFEAMTTLTVKRPGRAWAGLRTFLPDGRPAVGFDREAPGFFWLVGQGGFGMQTSPALSALAARLLEGGDDPLAAAFDPARLRSGD